MYMAVCVVVKNWWFTWKDQGTSMYKVFVIPTNSRAQEKSMLEWWFKWLTHISRKTLETNCVFGKIKYNYTQSNFNNVCGYGLWNAKQLQGHGNSEFSLGSFYCSVITFWSISYDHISFYLALWHLSSWWEKGELRQTTTYGDNEKEQ